MSLAGAIIFRKGDDDPPGDAEHQEGVDTLEEREKQPEKILCAACEHELAEGDAKTAVDGAHRHVKVNPHGHVFHISCFRPVPGVIPIGSPSAEFSWFAGYRWQIALCGGCQVHLGWVFVGESDFTALVQGRFVGG